MKRRKYSLKRALVTNLCITAIITFVYIMAFVPFDEPLFAQEPALKGTTGGKNVALQIAVSESSDVYAYMDLLEKYDAKGTFFFCEQCLGGDESILREVSDRGHGIGYYVCSKHTERQTALYIGGGYSIPVMSFNGSGGIREVCPSIDLTKLISLDNWLEVFEETVAEDMFIYLCADNNFSDFEKVVQIVLNKGYTILKVNEML